MQWPRDVSVLKSHDKKEKEYSQLGIDRLVVCWPRTFAEEEDEGVTPVPLRFITIRIATTARTIAAPLAPTAICQLLLALHPRRPALHGLRPPWRHLRALALLQIRALRRAN